MRVIINSLVVITLIVASTCEINPGQTQFDGCDLGWFRYKDYKCVTIFDFKVTYDEANEYCQTALGAEVLNITSQEERLFWSFHLLRYSNLSANVWLNKELNPKVSKLILNDQCLSLTSEYDNENRSVGSIVKQNCQSLGTTVCEIRTNKKVASKVFAKLYNLNEDFVPNKRLNYSNGKQSDLFTGTYYVLISKFKNKTLNNKIIGTSKCYIGGQSEANCASTTKDNDLNEKFSNYFMFTAEIGENTVQIRRFDSDKMIVVDKNGYLGNFRCYEDGLTNDGKEMCKSSLNLYNAVSTWRIDPYKDTNYHIIRSTHLNLTMGAVEYDDGKNLSVAFGLYSEEVNVDLDDKMLFQIVELNYTFDVQIDSIDFDGSLEHIMALNKKQISIVDTTTIINNSPATLTHEVASTKEMTETFSTSYGVSQNFMDSFTARNELGTSTSDTNSKSKSFSDSASEAISSSLTQSISQSSSDTEGEESSDSTTVEAKAGLSLSFDGIGLDMGGSTSNSWTDSETKSHTNTQTNDHSNTSSNDKEDSHSKTNTDDHSKSNTTNVNNSKENQHQNQTTTEKRNEQGGSRMRSYSIYKTVSLPPYSSVKISSYANWIDDLTIKYNLTLKFSANSFRRLTNGEGTNSWRTMDKEFVEYLLKKHKFTGVALPNKGFDYLYGRIEGFMKASIGLDSVFNAKETKLNK